MRLPKQLNRSLMNVDSRMNIIITNVFGIKNKGDQALLECLLESVDRSIYTDVQLTAVATNPADNEMVYPHIKWIGLPWTSKYKNQYLKKLFILLRALLFLILDLILGLGWSQFGRSLKQADLVIASPGGYLEDSTWSYFAHLFQLLLSVRLGKRLVLAPQSIGPIRNSIGRRLTRMVLRHAFSVYCRDSYSYDFAAKLHPSHGGSIVKTTDMVLLSEKLKKTGPCALISSVGITVLDWGCGGDELARSNYIATMRAAVKRLEQDGLKVFIIPQTSVPGNRDMDVALEVKGDSGAVLLGQPNSLEEYLSHFSKVDTIIGMRLHSCLLAIMSGVPAISVSYLPKCTDIMGDLGLSEFVVDINELEIEKLMSLVNEVRILDSRKKYWLKMSESRRHMSSAFSDLFENLLDVNGV
jgi:colanic acid/amylovoran biosynthesis protein